MTDRELLGWAAKAAAIDVGRYDDAAGLNQPNTNFWWNPLADDGDALRLAVRLSIRIYPPEPHLHDYNCNKASTNIFGKGWFGEEVEGADPYAATRRAIVRAAAEIGKAM